MRAGIVRFDFSFAETRHSAIGQLRAQADSLTCTQFGRLADGRSSFEAVILLLAANWQSKAGGGRRALGEACPRASPGFHRAGGRPMKASVSSNRANVTCAAREATSRLAIVIQEGEAKHHMLLRGDDAVEEIVSSAVQLT